MVAGHHAAKCGACDDCVDEWLDVARRRDAQLHEIASDVNLHRVKMSDYTDDQDTIEVHPTWCNDNAEESDEQSAPTCSGTMTSRPTNIGVVLG